MYCAHTFYLTYKKTERILKRYCKSRDGEMRIYEVVI